VLPVGFMTLYKFIFMFKDYADYAQYYHCFLNIHFPFKDYLAQHLYSAFGKSTILQISLSNQQLELMLPARSINQSVVL